MNRKLVLFAQQLEGYLPHFPSCHKYTLTQGIRQAYLDVYNLTTEAQKRPAHLLIPPAHGLAERGTARRACAASIVFPERNKTPRSLEWTEYLKRW